MSQTVYFNPITSPYENRAPGVIITGEPGSGKTHFMFVNFRNALTQRIRVFALDPKNDFKKLTSLDPNINYIDLNSDYSLDPFTCVKDLDTNFVMSMIETICNGLSNEQRNDITPIITDFVRMNKASSNTSFKKMTEYLYSNKNKSAQQIGNLLKSNEDSKIGNMLFNSNKNGLSVENKSTIFCLHGLPFPRDPKSVLKDWNQEERFASAIIMVLTKLLRNVLLSDNTTPVLFFIDEAHIILGNKYIYKIIEEFLILGRSLNICTILASQNISHFPEDFSNYVSNKFLFRCNKVNSEEFLRRFMINEDEDLDELINFSSKAESGQCIFIDRKGRISEIAISSNLGISNNPFFK